MLSLDYAKSRLIAFLAELERIKENDFPYPHSKDALEIIGNLFKRRLEILSNLDEDSDENIIRTACCESRDFLFIYLPFLGFIIRSTNVRNAFEAYGPLLRLSKELLGENTNLIISSEWDYSPFTYHGITHLPDFVLIGLPAVESDNPLLMPLAGHELGHSVWVRNNLTSEFKPNLIDAVVEEVKKQWEEFEKNFPSCKGVKPEEIRTNLFALQIWNPIVEWSLRQSEETFCDFIGLKIFGEAFLHAFAYLLSPGGFSQRSLLYPEMQRRFKDLISAAGEYKIQVPEEYENIFDVTPDIADTRQRLLLTVADTAATGFVATLIAKASDLVEKSKIPMSDDESIKRAYRRFELVIPSQASVGINNILIAGWRAFLANDLWENNKQVKHKALLLKELILKSIEVLEIEQLTSK